MNNLVKDIKKLKQGDITPITELVKEKIKSGSSINLIKRQLKQQGYNPYIVNAVLEDIEKEKRIQDIRKFKTELEKQKIRGAYINLITIAVTSFIIAMTFNYASNSLINIGLSYTSKLSLYLKWLSLLAWFCFIATVIFIIVKKLKIYEKYFKKEVKMKKAQIWVSAVLYIALGMVAITLILAAGVPLINKIKDKNTVIQTKELLYGINDNIRAVANEGPGSRRFISPLDIGRGELTVDTSNDIIRWSLKTKNDKLMEPDTEFQEGAITMYLSTTEIEGEFIANLELRYNSIDIALDSPYGSPFSGVYSLTMEHNGTYVQNKPTIILKII